MFPPSLRRLVSPGIGPSLLALLLLCLVLVPIGLSSALSTPNLPVVLRTDAANDFSEFQIRFANLRLDYNMSGETAATTEGGAHECSNTSLFVFIPTRPASFDVREQIRRTWASDLPREVVLKFVVGQPEEEDVYELLVGEMEERGDLILYSLSDNYENLYLKIYAALQWQQTFCPQAGYILKTDDDTVVDVRRLLHWIDQKFSQVVAKFPAAEFGLLWRGVEPNRNASTKWYVPEEIYAPRLYPNYLNGPSYMLTGEAVQRILEEAPNVNGFQVEDILYTGVLAGKAGVAKRDVPEHFHTVLTIKPVETCHEGVPLVTAIYPVSKPSKFHFAYKALRNARCK